MKGKIIVIEGGDGTGKATTAALVRSLLTERRPFGAQRIRTGSFPNYPDRGKENGFSSYYGQLIRHYLNGDSAAPDRLVPPEVRADPWLASLPYAAERRLAYQQVIRPALEQGDIFVFDRYVLSNSVYQGAKFVDRQDAIKFMANQQRFEYEMLGVPRPDLTIILDLPDDVRSQATAKRREEAILAGTTSGQVGIIDIHEQNEAVMVRSAQMYRYFAQFDGNILLECGNASTRLSPNEVAERVYTKILQRLPVNM